MMKNIIALNKKKPPAQASIAEDGMGGTALLSSFIVISPRIAHGLSSLVAHSRHQRPSGRSEGVAG
jgi:hypothetical protein